MSTATVIIIIGPANRYTQETLETTGQITVVNQDTVVRAIEYTQADACSSETITIAPGANVTVKGGIVLAIPYE